MGESMSWSAYLSRIDNLLAEGLSTGPVQTPELLEKSKLNRHRMQRILKTAKIPEDIHQLFSELPPHIEFLVITEGWCGDAAQILPYFERMAGSGVHRDRVRYVLRDETTYINDFLTNGSRAIPVIVAFNRLSEAVISSWGPRPASISVWYAAFKKENNMTKDQYSYQLHARYGKDRGKAFFDDMRVFISGILSKI